MVSLVLMINLTVSLAAMPLAFAAEDPPETKTIGEDGTLTVVQPYLSTEAPPVLPDTITTGGKNYTLDTLNTAVDPDYVRPTQFFARQAYNQVPVSGAGNWTAYFPATFPIDEGDYQGFISLDPVSPFYIAGRYHSYLVQVDKQVVFSGLPDNDVTRLPTYKDFEVVSDTSPGGTMIRTLQIVDVTYEIAGRDHLGLPNNYTAYVTYRGQEGLHELAFYDVTAHYSGELVSSVDQLTITGLYKPDEEPQSAATAAITSPDVPLAAAPGLPLFPLVVASTAVAVFLATPLLYFFVLSNARLIRVIRPQEEDEEEAGEVGKRGGKREKAKTKLICRRRLVLREGVARFRIPSNVNIFDGELYSLAIKPTFAYREGVVEMVWQGRIVAAMPLARYLDVNFTEILTIGTEAVLMELGLLD